jgi:hypothetical protein
MGKKRVVVEYIGKGVIVDSEKQICGWIHCKAI